MQLQELEGNNEENHKNISPVSVRPRQCSNWVHPKHKSDVLTLTAHSSPRLILINMYIEHKDEENLKCRKFNPSDADFGASNLNLERGETLK